MTVTENIKKSHKIHTFWRKIFRFFSNKEKIDIFIERQILFSCTHLGTAQALVNTKCWGEKTKDGPGKTLFYFQSFYFCYAGKTYLINALLIVSSLNWNLLTSSGGVVAGFSASFVFGTFTSTSIVTRFRDDVWVETKLKVYNLG